MSIVLLNSVKVCMQRIQDFLLRPDAQPPERIEDQPVLAILELVEYRYPVGPEIPALKTSAAAAGVGGPLGGPPKLGTVVLQDLSLQFQAGVLTGIVGRVGSGKSTLLRGILGDLDSPEDAVAAGRGGTLMNGSKSPLCSRVTMSVGFMPQHSFIFCGTVLENVLMGRPWNEELYIDCIRRAQMESDLAILAGGSDCEIGERGTTLSGGQQARLNLAQRSQVVLCSTFHLRRPPSMGGSKTSCLMFCLVFCAPFYVLCSILCTCFPVHLRTEQQGALEFIACPLADRRYVPKANHQSTNRRRKRRWNMYGPKRAPERRAGTSPGPYTGNPGFWSWMTPSPPWMLGSAQKSTRRSFEAIPRRQTKRSTTHMEGRWSWR